MEIKQLRVSDTLSFFKDRMMNKYNFTEYTDNKLPTIFFGIYTETDLLVLKRHKGYKVVLWSGTDIDYKNNKNVRIFMKYIKRMKKIHHISNSKFISDDLKYYKLPYKNIPVCGVDASKFKPVAKGKKIYIYTSAIKPTKYGSKMYNEVIKRLPEYKFILAANTKSIEKAKKLGHKYDKRLISLKPENMNRIYKQCFVGLRLTRHDGISYSVIEMGLCGIKCLHNGDQPNAIHYNTVDDIVRAIKKESKKIGYQHLTLSKQTKAYLKLDKRWKNTSYYFPKKNI